MSRSDRGGLPALEAATAERSAPIQDQPDPTAPPAGELSRSD